MATSSAGVYPAACEPFDAAVWGDEAFAVFDSIESSVQKLAESVCDAPTAGNECPPREELKGDDLVPISRAFVLKLWSMAKHYQRQARQVTVQSPKVASIDTLSQQFQRDVSLSDTVQELSDMLEAQRKELQATESALAQAQQTLRSTEDTLVRTQDELDVAKNGQTRLRAEREALRHRLLNDRKRAEAHAAEREEYKVGKLRLLDSVKSLTAELAEARAKNAAAPVVVSTQDHKLSNPKQDAIACSSPPPSTAPLARKSSARSPGIQGRHARSRNSSSRSSKGGRPADSSNPPSGAGVGTSAYFRSRFRLTAYKPPTDIADFLKKDAETRVSPRRAPASASAHRSRLEQH